MPRLNSFLDLLQYRGEEEFYQGEIGRIVGLSSRQNGGFIRRGDFQHDKTFWRKPLEYNYLDEEIYLPNGASMGGALMNLALDWYSKTNNWVQAVEQTRKMFSSMESLHYWIKKYISSFHSTHKATRSLQMELRISTSLIQWKMPSI